MKELMNIQAELRAAKTQKNNFGNYNYRSCEDILEAVKPLLALNECVLTISDEMVEVGGRVYVKATVTLRRSKEPEILEQTTAFAREPESKKGMDPSQITGAASSYARKYALNGLFCIDDNKDADTMPPPVPMDKQINECKTVDALGKLWSTLNKKDQYTYELIKNARKEALEGKK